MDTGTDILVIRVHRWDLPGHSRNCHHRYERPTSRRTLDSMSRTGSTRGSIHSPGMSQRHRHAVVRAVLLAPEPFQVDSRTFPADR